MNANLHNIFLRLVRLGIGCTESTDALLLTVEEWGQLKALAGEQGLSAIVLDGMGAAVTNLTALPKHFRLEWIGQVLQRETQFVVQQKAAGEMALLFHHDSIRTYVLKGLVVAECYPKPSHRVSVDMDCFLTEETGFKSQVSSSNEVPETRNMKSETIWERGNRIIEGAGFEVKRDFYKNSTFFFPGLTVENHRFLTPFRGNARLKRLEKWFQSQLSVLSEESEQARTDSLKFIDSSEVDSRRFEGTCLYRPPVMVSALFLIEHAYSHFLHEGLTWRHVLDWQMFSSRHKDEIDWPSLGAYIDEFGFRLFYDSYARLGQYLLGELAENDLSPNEKLMLIDVWAPLDLHDTVKGLKGKFALAGNTWRARWKYRHFAEISWLQALWIQVKGVVFDKNPKL